MKKREYYAEQLNNLLSDEDLTNEKLREAYEGLLPNIAYFLNKTKFKKWCIKTDVDNFSFIQEWSGIIELNYGVFVYHDKTCSIFKHEPIKEISTKRFLFLIKTNKPLN